mmetsp:Transcript_23487/g.34804  ORF Transcript_23487/g.34804 Transcript_23487/m.34804 type:complete len:318 (+) Transcript_23487:64-1017(+)
MTQDYDDDEEPASAMCFSQFLPEESQAPPSAKLSEQDKLQNMDPSARSRLVTDLSRYILFKSLSNDPIDRTKLAKEAFPKNLQDARVTNAALQAATERMNQIFGLDVLKAPKSIVGNKTMPSKFKERLFVVNKIKDNEMGLHSKSLHGIHIDAMVEKGLLMLVLAFIYCKGEIKDHIRWLDGGVLYRLLHSVDENIPAEPAAEIKHKKEGGIGGIMSPSAMNMEENGGGSGGVGLTPDVDIALEKFVHLDYLVKKKFDRAGDGIGDDTFSYAIGPRAWLVVGERQIICFCAQVLDQEPDPTMLQELNNGNGEGKMEQ